jgi:kynurenine formamidase
LINLPLIFCVINFDLTHTIKSTNPGYPGIVPFNFTQVYTGWGLDDSNENYFKALNTFITSEHFSTHIDAPYHGSNTSWTVEQIPFERLVSIQGLIVDVSKKSSRIPNYQISIEDLNENVLKEANGFFVLLFYTGKTQFWPDQIAYAGGDTRETLEFPGLSAQLASYLVDQYSEKLVGVGIDTLSSKYQRSSDFLCLNLLF